MADPVTTAPATSMTFDPVASDHPDAEQLPEMIPYVPPVPDLDVGVKTAIAQDQPPRIPGLITPGNIDLDNRPVVTNPDGSYSTVRTITTDAKDGNGTVLLPTIINGKMVPIPDAIEHYRQTGEHMGVFDTPENADKYDSDLHTAKGWNGPQNQWPTDQGGSGGGGGSGGVTLAPKFRGVLQGKEDAIVQAAQNHNVDPKLFGAIVALESGWGTSSAIKKYNGPAGVMTGKTAANTQHAAYPTIEAGLDAAAANLQKNFISQGMTTPEQIGPRYAPIGAANDPHDTNSNWIPSVKSIMRHL